MKILCTHNYLSGTYIVSYVPKIAFSGTYAVSYVPKIVFSGT